MLTLTIPGDEMYDESKNEFIYTKETTVKMEHSLISLSLWERYYKKPFLSTEEKTTEEIIYYIKCMMLQPVEDKIIKKIALSKELSAKIQAYISDPYCATVVNQKKEKGGSNEPTTAEIIYYDMIALQIPIEFEKWHLNRLLTLIQVCSIKNSPPKKMSMKERLAHTRDVNAANRAKYGM